MVVTVRSPFLVVSPWRTLPSLCSTSRRSLASPEWPPRLDSAPGWGSARVGSRVREPLAEVPLLAFLFVCVPRVLDGPDAGDTRGPAPVWLCLAAASGLVLLSAALLGLDGLGAASWPFLATLGLEETLTLVDFVFVPCDLDVVVFVPALETLDLVVDALWVFELLRLLACFRSASVLLHRLVAGLECVALSGLAEGACGRGRTGSGPNTPGRVEGPPT